MSYANASVSSAERVRAATTVIGIHALLGAGLIAGLAVSAGVIDRDGPIEVTEIPFDPPPPPEQVEELPDDVVIYQPPTAPIPDIPLERDSPINVVTPDDSIPPLTNRIPVDPPVVVETPVTPSLPAFTPAPPVPRNAMTDWITASDYSRRDLTRGNEGMARYRLVVGSDGRVDNCEITRSTGHATLDTATCRLISQRARFNPATNNRGEDVVGTYTGSVTWQIPE